jgi:hypothetical protein
MKAVIGRAREAKSMVEVELMSSTSGDVCELWNGDGVVRVLGTSPIIELFYIELTPVDLQIAKFTRLWSYHASLNRDR